MPDWQPIHRWGDEDQFVIHVCPLEHRDAHYVGVVADKQGVISAIIRPGPADYHDCEWGTSECFIDGMTCHAEPVLNAIHRESLNHYETTYATVAGLLRAINARDGIPAEIADKRAYLKQKSLLSLLEEEPDPISKYAHLDEPPAELAEALTLFQLKLKAKDLCDIREIIPSSNLKDRWGLGY